ncbi:MAG: hypothetical protein KDE32_09815 [Novosphingobium sp.]|nr:hypothetical protein [Novosphingobium sp.]
MTQDSNDTGRYISAEAEKPWLGLFGDKQDFYDDCGFTLTASTDEHDIMVGNFMYFFQGGKQRPKSQWLGDGIANNNLVVITPKDRRGKGMYDNNFSRNGMNLEDYFSYDDLKVTEENGAVVWRMGKMEYVLNGPHYAMRGISGECEYDIRFTQLDAPAVWSFGTREAAPQAGIAGGYCYLEAEGTLKVGKTTYDIRGGRGVHERLGFSETLDPNANSQHDVNGFGNAFAIHILGGDVWVWGLGSFEAPMFFLTVEGKDLTFLPGAPGTEISYELLDPWHDPRSGLYMPSRFRANMTSPEGRLELEMQATGRAYYPWEMKRGYQFMYWHLGISNGAFTWPDGRIVPIENQITQHELVKHLISHRETMDGPDRTAVWA